MPQLKRLKLVLTLEALGTEKQLAAAAAVAQQQEEEGKGAAAAAAAAAGTHGAATALVASSKQQQDGTDVKNAAAGDAGGCSGCSDAAAVRDNRSPSHLVMAVAAAAAAAAGGGNRRPGGGGVGGSSSVAAAAMAMGVLERRLQLLQQLQNQARDVLAALEDSRKGSQSQQTAASSSTTSGTAAAAVGTGGNDVLELISQAGGSPLFNGSGGGGGFAGGTEGGFAEGGESTIAVLGSDGGSVAPSIATASGVASAAGSVVDASTPRAATGGGTPGRGGRSSSAATTAGGGGGGAGGSEGRGFSAHRLLRRRSGRRRGGASGAVQEVSETSLALEQPTEQPLLSLESFVPARTVSALHQAIKGLVKCSSLSKKQQEANAAAAATAAGEGVAGGRAGSAFAGGLAGSSSRGGRRVGEGDVGVGVTGAGVTGAPGPTEGGSSPFRVMSPALGIAGAVVPHFTFSQGALWAEQEHSLGLLRSCLQSIQACVTLGQQVLDHLAAAGSDDAALERLLPSALEGLDDRLFALSTGMMLPHSAAAGGVGFNLGLNRASPNPPGLRVMHGGAGWGSAGLGGGGGLLGGEEPVRLQLLPRGGNSSGLGGIGGRGMGAFGGAVGGWGISGSRVGTEDHQQQQQQGVLEDELGLLLGRSLRSAGTSDGAGGGLDSPVSVEWRLLDRGSAPTGAFLPLHSYGPGSSSGRISLSRRSQDGLNDRGNSSSASSSRRGLRHRHRHSSRSNQSSTIMSRERSLSLNPLGSRLPLGPQLRHQVTPLYDPLDLPGRHPVPSHHHSSRSSSSSSLRGRVSLLPSLNPRSSDPDAAPVVASAASASAVAAALEADAGETFLLSSRQGRRELSVRNSSTSSQQQQQQWQPLLPSGGGSTPLANPLSPGEVVVAGTVINPSEEAEPLAPASLQQQQQHEVGQRRSFYSSTTRGWGFLVEHLAQTAAGRQGCDSRALSRGAAAGTAASCSDSINNPSSSAGAARGVSAEAGVEGVGAGVPLGGSRGVDAGAGAAVAQVLRGSGGSGEVAPAEPAGVTRNSGSSSNRPLAAASRPTALQVPVTPTGAQQAAAAGGVPSSPATPFTYATADSLVSELSGMSSVELASARSSVAAGSEDDAADGYGGGEVTSREQRLGGADRGSGGSPGVADEQVAVHQQQQQQLASAGAVAAAAAGGVGAGVSTARRSMWGAGSVEISAALPTGSEAEGGCSRGPRAAPSYSMAAASGSSRGTVFGGGNRSGYQASGGAGAGGVMKVSKCAEGLGQAGGTGLDGCSSKERKQRMLAYSAAAGAATDGSLAEEEAGTCPICMDRPVALQVSRCAHGLCLLCAFQLCSKGRNAPLCPFCRQTIGDFEAAAASTI